MALVTRYKAIAAYQRAVRNKNQSAEKILRDARDTNQNSFDIFLSHSYMDKKLILGAKTLLEENGKTVYVDWITDEELDRTKVTKDTAKRMRRRMKQSTSLFYAHSDNASVSRWMPWELGYFDALKGLVAVFPIVENANKEFPRQEYLDLYPYINLEEGTVWVVNYNTWIEAYPEWLKRYRRAA